jgi:hypothetical protein
MGDPRDLLASDVGLVFPVNFKFIASMAGALATVDVEDFAGHEAGPFEVEDRIDDVGNLAQPADWVQVASCAYSDGMHWRLDGARRHRVHSDPALGILDRKRFVAVFRPPFVSAAGTAGQLIPFAEAVLRQIGANAPLAVKFVLDAQFPRPVREPFGEKRRPSLTKR